MSMWSKWVVVAVVLAIIVPIAVRTIRRMARGEAPRSSGPVFIPPPSGPDIGGGPGP